MLSSCMMSAVVLLTAYSSAVAAVEGGPTLEPPANANAPWAIEWLSPDLKDAATPRTLVLCSDRMDEQLRRYRSLIEKLSVLKGHTILDGSKPVARKQQAGSIGYIIIAHQGKEDLAVNSCAANYPEVRAFVTDFMEKELLAQQNEVQDLIRLGILPKSATPRQCFGKSYYPAEGTKTWQAHVNIDGSSDDRCLDEFLPVTFGINPNYCSSSAACR
ncbi:hypothetical protein HFO32_02060 [Rhizobium leguminosarum]|uniref:hypothetical protein n=3 Tax=Rhizobium leguminosarum TaxID=384 RepID=UPI001C965224|nr:hypothetical protein [Rhizobium leguminosarum]MBY5640085.1 hypothetical protein [Rhizobium leguminosarum]MBY5668496.1 hypothetical protein [Rhizobium leguminosarum]MBY5680985.1 hypothetical protein [Rhizobium leguminosarum]